MLDKLVARVTSSSPKEPVRARPACPTDAPDRDLVGICCSGGGVRSASYCLGALQVLREKGVYEGADFLSAVSGGSYIASALVTTAVVAERDGTAPLTPRSFAPGSPEERHLRTHSSYMAPGSGGKARLLLHVLTGMVYNVLAVGAVIAIVAIPLAWIYGGTFGQLHNPKLAGTLHVHLWELCMFGALVFLIGALSLELWAAEAKRPWADRWAARVAVFALGAFVVLIVVPQGVLTARAIAQGGIHLPGEPSGQAKDASGLFALVNVGALLTAAAGALSTFVSRRRQLLLHLAAFVAGPLLVLTFVMLIVNAGATAPGARYAVVALAALVGACLLIWYLADLTQWSLHPFYRRRLGSAFHVRRVTGQGQPRAEPLGAQHPLTWEQLAHSAKGPELLVCAAANATEEGDTPPGRAAVPFVFTPHHVGVPGNLDRPPPTIAEYREGAAVERYLNLPEAVAMSGAAVSPLMGKKTVWAVRFLMGLMNVRLGVWMPNPLVAQERRAEGKEPLRGRPRPHYLFKEMFGRASLKDPYLYVTDGGHFDNLGIVELLRRGCTTIFCLDGGGDPAGTFRALGDAVALARSELQVDVTIDPSAIIPDAKRMSQEDFALGTYRFRALPEGSTDLSLLDIEGHIVYCRAAVTEDAPWDVRAFHERDKRFPYHSTLDQLFTDEKFESYRALGSHTARRALRKFREETVRHRIVELLQTCARARQCVTYDALVRAVRPERLGAGLDTLRPLLADIARAEKAAGRPPLQLLVQDADAPATLRAELETVYEFWEQIPPRG